MRKGGQVQFVEYLQYLFVPFPWHVGGPEASFVDFLFLGLILSLVS